MEKIKKWLESRIEEVNNAYDKEVNIYFDKSIGMLNTSLLSQKEKEDLLNKRNCLIVQRTVYKEVLDKIKGE